MRKTFNNYPVWHFTASTSAYTETNALFPPELWAVPEPPKEIFIQGSRKALDLLQRLPEEGLAIVGTRNPEPRSLALVEKQIKNLAGTPLIILSGLARGIDTAAHTAALKWGLPTIAFLGTGLQFTFPQSNVRLRQEILEEGGLIVSEFPFEMPGLGYQFLQRNRLIAGWAKATWVVEAGKKSGALNTARWARDLDRTCYAVPCFPGDPALAGNQTLLDRDHALHFWGTHSLGATWLELATRSAPQLTHSNINENIHQLGFPDSSSLVTYNRPSPSDSEILTQQVKIWTYQKGGTQIHELMDWAASESWSPARFFTAFEEAVRQEWVSERSGTVIGL
ncbi:MAG: DNA-processing protein DprA [Bdellovibrionia bacterium]